MNYKKNFIPNNFLSVSNWMMHNIMYHPEKKIIFFLTPKVANTSLKKSILFGSGFQVEQEYDAGFVFVSPQDVFFLKKEDPSIYSIGFVRNPLDRFISAWKNKFYDQARHNDTCFSKLIENIKTTDELYMDKHFRSQSFEMIYDRYLLIDKYYKFEDFTTPTGWDILTSDLKKNNIELSPLDHLNKSNMTNPEILSEELCFIYNRYKNDYLIFNY